MSSIFGDMDYVIRLAKKNDASSFYGISLRSHTASYYDQLIPQSHKDAFYAHYQWSIEDEDEFTRNTIRKITHPEWHVAVAEQDGDIIGYMIAHSKIEGKLMLRGLFVDPSSHSKGVGTALFELSLTWAKSGDVIELSVIEKNTVARGLYEKHNFKIVGKINQDFFGAKMVRMQRNTIDKT